MKNIPPSTPAVSVAVELDIRDIEIIFSHDRATWDATARRQSKALFRAREVLPTLRPDMWLKLHVPDYEFVNEEILGLLPANVPVQVVADTPSAAARWRDAITASRAEYAA